MIYIALENIRSLYNIGALFRTCSFFGVYEILLVGYSGRNFDTFGNSILHEEIAKTALGTQDHMNIQFLDSARDLIEFSNNARAALVCAEQHSKSLPLTSWTPKINENTIIVFGNEVDGVSSELLDAASVIIEIPQIGKHNSLNITTSCGIVLHHVIMSEQNSQSYGPIV